jgi:hypothetical protein
MAVKPFRRNRRYFSSCDAARIAREVVKDRGETPEEVLSCIAKGLGFTHISLSRNQTVQAGSGKAAVIIARASFSVLRSALLLLRKEWPSIFSRLGRIIEALDTIERVLDRLFDDPEQAKVEDLAKCKCKDQPKVII